MLIMLTNILFKNSFWLLLVLALTAGCVAETKKKASTGRPHVSGLAEPEEFFGNFSGEHLRVSRSGSYNVETLWALAQCECDPVLYKSFMERTANGKGVLPQILMPSVREEIKSNTALQTLQKIPLGGLLADFFASDEKLAGRIREGLAEKLTRAPGGSSLASRLDIRFDGFTPVAGRAPSFSVMDQIPRWMAVFSADGLWTGAETVDGSDHGLQTLELFRSLSEWTYMIGLDENTDGGFYGGLTLRADGAGAVMNGPIDPRKGSDSKWFVSGAYTLKYDEKNARDLATSVKETWSHNNEPVTLDEQARLWHVAARAFGRLRPENRKSVATLFAGGEEALLPADSHTLPLAFLASIDTLLPEAFIDRDVRLIRASASFDGKSSTPASLLALSRLVRALTSWSQELKTADQAGLNAETLRKVRGAPEELLPAIQLAVQTILANHVAPAVHYNGSYGLALVDNGKAVKIAEASEVLLALTEVEAQLLDSEFLRGRIQQIFDWYGGDLLQSGADISERELLWIKTAARAAERYAGDRAQVWVKDAGKYADELLQRGSL